MEEVLKLIVLSLLLARGRDRLETEDSIFNRFAHLGDSPTR